MRESAIEKAVCAHAKAIGVTTIKLSGPNDRGKADRLFMKNGKAIFIEFKATGEMPTPLQDKFLAERRRDGFFASWTDSIAQGITWLHEEFGS